MFLVPLSLFMVTTYLRPRTEAELSYLITAIECLSGLWCLLFAPLAIQLTLIGLVLIRNARQFSTMLSASKPSSPSFQDLSDTSTPTIDIEAQPIVQSCLPESPKASTPLPSSPQTDTAALATSAAVLETSPVNDHGVASAPIQPLAALSEATPSSTPASILEKNMAETDIMICPPEETLNHYLSTQIQQPHTAALSRPPHVIEMHYRGVTYFKSIR